MRNSSDSVSATMLGRETRRTSLGARSAGLLEPWLLCQPQAEVLGGDILQRVRLIKDRHLIIGQDIAAQPPDSQVGEEQRVIDDEDVSAVHALARLEVEALLVVLALATQAVAAIALHQFPDDGQRLHGEIALAAVLCPSGPFGDFGQLDVGGPLRQKVP